MTETMRLKGFDAVNTDDRFKSVNAVPILSGEYHKKKPIKSRKYNEDTVVMDEIRIVMLKNLAWIIINYF